MLRLSTDHEKITTWEEAGHVTVPAGTKRRTVIERALKLPDLRLPPQPGWSTVLMVIPKKHATRTPVTLEQPEPQLRIG